MDLGVLASGPGPVRTSEGSGGGGQQGRDTSVLP